MNTASLYLTARKPVSMLQKPINADLKALFKAVGKGMFNISTSHLDKVGSDFFDAAFALGLKTQPEELAYLLIQRSLARAITDLTSDAISSMTTRQVVDLSLLETSLDQEMTKTKFTINEEFFRAPGRFEALDLVKTLLHLWLKMCGMTSQLADLIVVRLPSYFVYAVHYELGRNASSYKPIFEVLNTAVSEAVNREQAWQMYSALLERQTQENVFGEPYSLRQIYVPLLAAANPDVNDSVHKKSTIVELESELTKWLHSENHKDMIRILSGEPGSGKSVFMKIFAANIATLGHRVLLVPLHLIDPERDIVDELGRFARHEGLLGYDPFNTKAPEHKLILIFDGLDELAGQSKEGFNSARHFVDSVERFVDRSNLRSCALRVLFSGRDLIVHENSLFFKRAGQILELLPYHLTVREKEQYSDPKQLLKKDSRQDWWIQYGNLVGIKYSGLPSDLAIGELFEMTRQPLLNYLIALTMAPGRATRKFDRNFNSVYAELIKRVYERGYEEGRVFPPIRHMKFEDFQRMLEEIGLAAWQGNGRSTTVSEIRRRCEASAIERTLKDFQEGAERGVTSLLAAFFFRRFEQRETGDQTFVFTHKTFGEYLAARRIVFTIRKIARDVIRRDKDPDDGCDLKDALVNWCSVCGPSSFSHFQLILIRQEIALEITSTIREWQKVFLRLFNLMFANGMPIENLRLDSFKESSRQSRNAEEGLLIALNACALKTKLINKIDFPSVTTFGTWYRRIQEQRENEFPNVASECFSYMDLSKCHLNLHDLYGTNLENTILSESKLHYGALTTLQTVRASLKGVNFVKSEMDSIFPPYLYAESRKLTLQDGRLVYVNQDESDHN